MFRSRSSLHSIYPWKIICIQTRSEKMQPKEKEMKRRWKNCIFCVFRLWKKKGICGAHCSHPFDAIMLLCSLWCKKCREIKRERGKEWVKSNDTKTKEKQEHLKQKKSIWKTISISFCLFYSMELFNGFGKLPTLQM